MWDDMLFGVNLIVLILWGIDGFLEFGVCGGFVSDEVCSFRGKFCVKFLLSLIILMFLKYFIVLVGVVYR